MLARTRAEAFSREGWLFEIKYDGFRLLAARVGGEPQLWYRGGGEATTAFPEIAEGLATLPGGDLLLDGELVALREDGRPSFQLLQQRYRGSRRRGTGPGAPCCFRAFDLLGLEGFDLRPVPLSLRKAALALVVPSSGTVARVEHVEAAGEQLYAEIRRLGLEGMIAKRAESPYTGGRSGDWLKVRIDRAGEFFIVGFTHPELGSEGGLHLAAPDGTYAGRVGSGFQIGVLTEVRALLTPFRRKAPPCRGPAPRGRGHTWVEPRVRCEVRYKERTDEGLLRHPVFLRFVSGSGVQSGA
jgi:bifunctional non-homologous end joining protein LigD